ncbi:MAG: hypothetical protein Q8922_02075 [Bacteroidota bacterium]|nr:hypothetical protein [Bacteroidota bacterium]MDP4232337.1 hypothetical protein [Bacteroidota bacterium]MDP4241476.1 hypothetical protein [Bacteroidota bacterium]MDP4286700.1 hypothetical protein [Bacteroidota bacterium]
MKTIVRKPLARIVVLLTVAAVLGFAKISGAQEIQSNSQQPGAEASLTFQASNSNTDVISFEKVRSITESSLREAIGSQLNSVTPEEIGKKLSGGYEALKQGQTISFNAPVAALAARTITEQHIMQVRVAYEPRPIGGILTIKVELVPLFSGIGSASRPIAYREISEAVDNLDEDGLGDLVAGLTHQLGAEYAVK